MDYNYPGAFVDAMNSLWFKLLSELHDIIMQVTVSYATSRNLKALFLPVTTRTVTCPSALGSDSAPIPVSVNEVETYLADSMQFALEYGCRLSGDGCYSITSSFRKERQDRSHLIQFTHSEVEMVGDLEDLMQYVNGYIQALAGAILDRLGDYLAMARGDISHLQRMVDRSKSFEQLTFEEAVQVVADVDGAIRYDKDWRTLTRKGELMLLERVSEVVWVHHFDNLAVPFYQAFGDDEAKTSANADMLLGMGEIVGSGERHGNAADLRKSMVMHGVDEAEYEWYVRMREEAPMTTSGFGLGVDRFLMWVLKHNDIRDMPLISRQDEPNLWPSAVTRP
ncbi:MAG TPA: amino acid--tRNA ligase-related protein [Streptosporangiaceae bacterium]